MSVVDQGAVDALEPGDLEQGLGKREIHTDQFVLMPRHASKNFVHSLEAVPAGVQTRNHRARRCAHDQVNRHARLGEFLQHAQIGEASSNPSSQQDRHLRTVHNGFCDWRRIGLRKRKTRDGHEQDQEAKNRHLLVVPELFQDPIKTH